MRIPCWHRGTNSYDVQIAGKRRFMSDLETNACPPRYRWFSNSCRCEDRRVLSHLNWIAKIFVFILLLIILTVAISFLFWCLDMHWNALKLRWLVPLSKIRVCVFVHYNIKLKPLVLLVLLFIIRESHINIDSSDNSNQSLTYMYVGTCNIYVPIYILV